MLLCVSMLMGPSSRQLIHARAVVLYSMTIPSSRIPIHSGPSVLRNLAAAREAIIVMRRFLLPFS